MDTIRALLSLFLALSVLALFIGPVLGLFRSAKLEARDVIAHGVPAIGTVRNVRADRGKGGTLWRITVEFSVPERAEPVQFEAVAMSSLFSRAPPKAIGSLNVGDPVRIHYLTVSPSLAVIDDLVG